MTASRAKRHDLDRVTKFRQLRWEFSLDTKAMFENRVNWYGKFIFDNAPKYDHDRDFNRRWRRRLDDRRRADGLTPALQAEYSSLGKAERLNRRLGNVLASHRRKMAHFRLILGEGVDHNLNYCGMLPILGKNAAVVASKKADGSLGKSRMGNIAYCRSAMSCPTCAADMWREWARELRYINDKAWSEGFMVFFLTLTSPHYQTMDGVEYANMMRDAQSKLFSKSPYNKAWRHWVYIARKQGGDVLGRAVRWEDPYSTKHGFNVHCHEELFVKGLTEDQLRQLEDDLRAAWKMILDDKGLVSLCVQNGFAVDDAVSKCGVEFTKANSPQDIERIIRYMSIEELMDFMADGGFDPARDFLAEEMTDTYESGQKKGRSPYTVQAFNILRYCVGGAVDQVIKAYNKAHKAEGEYKLKMYWADKWYTHVTMFKGYAPFYFTGKIQAWANEYRLIHKKTDETQDLYYFPLAESVMTLYRQNAIGDVLRAVDREKAGGFLDAGEYAREKYGVEMRRCPGWGERSADVPIILGLGKSQAGKGSEVGGPPKMTFWQAAYKLIYGKDSPTVYPPKVLGKSDSDVSIVLPSPGPGPAPGAGGGGGFFPGEGEGIDADAVRLVHRRYDEWAADLVCSGVGPAEKLAWYAAMREVRDRQLAAIKDGSWAQAA